VSRHGHRKRSLSGTFGKVEIDVPRARLQAADGKTTELSRAFRVHRLQNRGSD
jgi:putative transposase